jgi:Domain of unknown function (DUF4349)
MTDHTIKLGAAAGGILLVAVLVLALFGGQTSMILSNVGAAVGDSSAGGGSGDGSTSGADGDTGSSGSAPDSAADGSAAQVAALQPLSLLVVHSGTLTLHTASIDDAISAAGALVGRAGGFVASSNEAGTGSDANAVVSYRIPAAAWESTLAALSRIGTVRDQAITAEDVGGTVLDLGARIANLRSTEGALQAIMAKATRIDDVLAVQKQLTDTRGEIEQLTAKKAGLENRAAFGSLTVRFRLPSPAPTPRATPRPPTWDPGADAAQATAKLVRIGQKAGTAGIWLAIVGLPLLIALAVVLAVAWGAYRLASRRGRRSSGAPT